MQRNIKLQTINPYLMCTLCSGYLIDATTLVECLHSFCKSCLLKYLESSYNCPKCGMEIHKTKPLEHIRSDPCLQEIVYKLVPDLFAKEESRKHSWKNDDKTDLPALCVTKDEVQDDSRILVTLKYFRGTSRMERIKTEKVLQMFPTRYLCCNPDMPVRVLKKFVYSKFDISADVFHVELWRGDETLLDELTLKQLVQIYGLYRERKPLDLHFSLYPKFDTKPIKDPTPVKKTIPKYDPAEQMKRISKMTDGKEIPNVSEKEDIKEEKLNGFHSESISSRDNQNKSESPIDEGDKESGNGTILINRTIEQSNKEEEKSNESRLEDNLLLKDEIKNLSVSSSKSILNTTDSDSSQKSNVSSLDVNLLMEDDFKPETLENDFLKLFDSDSQHNSDVDASCFDVNLSMDSDIEKISKTLGNDILNLFDTDCQYDDSSNTETNKLTNSEPKVVKKCNIPKNVPSICHEGKRSLDTSEVGNSKVSCNKSDVSSAIDIPLSGVTDDIPESPVDDVNTPPVLPEISSVSRLQCNTSDNIPEAKPKSESCHSGIHKETLTEFIRTSESSENTIAKTESAQYFDMSKLGDELTMGSDSDINLSPSFKSSIKNNNANSGQTCSISPLETDLILIENQETLENDIIKLLASDAPNDSDVNSSMENDIMDISASLEKDLQNLLDSEPREDSDNYASNVNTSLQQLSIPIEGDDSVHRKTTGSHSPGKNLRNDGDCEEEMDES